MLALVMRAIFIALGAALLPLFSFMFLVFGLLLLYTAVHRPTSGTTRSLPESLLLAPT